jgi:hypothetical protein
MKKLIILSVSILISCSAYCQEAVIADASAALQNIYQSYDSLYNLTFDIKFNYSSDTTLGKSDNETIQGTYTMARKKAHYRLGNLEFMQNDEYFFSVYHNERLLIIDEPKTKNIGKQLPFREIIDSLLQAQSSHYSFSKQNISGTTDKAFIKLQRQDSVAQFDEFEIKYNHKTNLVEQIIYKYKEPVVLDSASADILSGNNNAIPLQQKRLTVTFSDYRVLPDADKLFDYNNYIWFNEEEKCLPVKKYKDYQLVNNKPNKVIRQ